MCESFFKIKRVTRSLATPARCSRGRIQERAQGDTAYRRRFPLYPLCKLRRGSPPFEPPLVERCPSLSQPACRKRLVILERPRHLDNALCSCGSDPGRRSLLRLRPSQAPRRHGPPRPSAPRRFVDDAPGSARVALAHGLSSARIPAKPLLGEAFHSSFSARTTWRLPLRASLHPPYVSQGSRKTIRFAEAQALRVSAFPLASLRWRVRRARRKAPDGARTYREGERSWKNFTQRQRR